MKRESLYTVDSPFDLVVVGAGIHGAVLACEAARCGYKVALFDKGDFGSATSANSLKIIHGGIRYLQHGDFKRMRESILSRRAMMRFAPHLVRPLECMMPTYGHGIRGREIMRTAFGVYDLIASDRNSGIAQENRLPASKTISAREVTWAVEGIESQNLTGGAIWYDAIADNTERLILEYVKEAARYGALVMNYARVTDLMADAGRVTGVQVCDELENRTVTLGCRAVVSASGPWLPQLATGERDQLWSSAVNIVVKKQLFKKYAVGLEGCTEYEDKDALVKRGKRLFFFVPWRENFTMIGTSYKPYHGNVDDFELSQLDIEELLGEINKIYPKGDLTLGDVSYFHAGLLPMNEADEKTPDSVQLDKSSRIIVHGENGGPSGFFSIKGVKYTTAPDIAEKVLRILEKSQICGSKERGSYCSEKRQQLDFGPVATALGENYGIIKQHLQKRYGTGWREVFAILVSESAGKPEVLQGDNLWLVDNPRLLGAELLHFIRNEMAVNLGDVVFRRSEVASAECPTDTVLEYLARGMGDELGWSEEQRLNEIETVKRVFAPIWAAVTKE